MLEGDQAGKLTDAGESKLPAHSNNSSPGMRCSVLVQSGRVKEGSLVEVILLSCWDIKGTNGKPEEWVWPGKRGERWLVRRLQHVGMGTRMLGQTVGMLQFTQQCISKITSWAARPKLCFIKQCVSNHASRTMRHGCHVPWAVSLNSCLISSGSGSQILNLSKVSLQLANRA